MDKVYFKELQWWLQQDRAIQQMGTRMTDEKK